MCCQKAAQKHGWYPCQSVLRASQNQAAALNRRKILRQPCSCRPGMRAHAARDGIRAFAIGYYAFYESAESVPISLGPGKSGREIRNLYTGTRGFPICQSCIPAGIFAIYMTDRSRILPWSFRISFSIHLYCISPLFLQPAFEILSIFKKSVCSVHSSIDRRKYENIIKFFISTFTKTRFFRLIEQRDVKDLQNGKNPSIDSQDGHRGCKYGRQASMG